MRKNTRKKKPLKTLHCKIPTMIHTQLEQPSRSIRSENQLLPLQAFSPMFFFWCLFCFVSQSYLCGDSLHSSKQPCRYRQAPAGEETAIHKRSGTTNCPHELSKSRRETSKPNHNNFIKEQHVNSDSAAELLPSCGRRHHSCQPRKIKCLQQRQ